MEFKDITAAAAPPQGNPPPYSAEPPGQTSFSTAPPGQMSFSAAPPGPGPYTAPQGQTHIFVAAQPRAMVHTVVVQQMGSVPASTVCKSCNHQIVTRVETKPTIRTHLFALILCMIGCWPFACVPYCMDSCNNADHYCPNCNSYIGSYIS